MVDRNCGTTEEINRVLLPNMALNMETRLNQYFTVTSKSVSKSVVGGTTIPDYIVPRALSI